MHFEKISYDQYQKDNNEMPCFEEWNDLKLPERATKFSAGYDIFAPYEFTLEVGETIKVATGIRIFLNEDKYLMCVPRSGHGFKYRIQLDNTVGIIDSDYVFSDNEGHIWVKITNDGKEGKKLKVMKGEAFCQGIINQYYLIDDDAVINKRNGGFGSTK